MKTHAARTTITTTVLEPDGTFLRSIEELTAGADAALATALHLVDPCHYRWPDAWDDETADLLRDAEPAATT